MRPYPHPRVPWGYPTPVFAGARLRRSACRVDQPGLGFTPHPPLFETCGGDPLPPFLCLGSPLPPSSKRAGVPRPHPSGQKTIPPPKGTLGVPTPLFRTVLHDGDELASCTGGGLWEGGMPALPGERDLPPSGSQREGGAPGVGVRGGMGRGECNNSASSVYFFIDDTDSCLRTGSGNHLIAGLSILSCVRYILGDLLKIIRCSGLPMTKRVSSQAGTFTSTAIRYGNSRDVTM